MILLYPVEMNDGKKHKKPQNKNHATTQKRKANIYSHNDLGGYILELWVMVICVRNLRKGKVFNMMEKHL